MRIGIVNDLALAREVLRRVVTSVPGYSVAWMAADGEDAVTKAAADKPDVILMDLVMPRVDGVEATKQIMRKSPCPVLVVTASVATNYSLACRAMGVGALDAVDTPTLGPGGVVQNAEKLIARLGQLQTVLTSDPNAGSMTMPCLPGPTADFPPLVLLGASTGGPEALAAVLSAFPANLPASVLIAQHIAADFAPGLIQQLSARCKLPVRAAHAGDTPTAGVVYVAASNDHMELSAERSLKYTPKPHHHPYRPSVDVLFASAAARSPRVGVAALLTGMGNDGAEGLLRLRAAGWHTMAQDEATSIVYGMPKAAVEKRAAMEVVPLHFIGDTIVARIQSLKRR